MICFRVLSVEEYAYAQRLLESYHSNNNSICSDLQEKITIPTIIVQVLSKIQVGNGYLLDATVHIELPKNYPNAPASVYIISITNCSTSKREELGYEMNQRARELSGSEALMELIHFFQDSMTSCCWVPNNIHRFGKRFVAEDDNDDAHHGTSMETSRCWIWVHHITNTGRRKDIVREARERKLGGYLKHGYPGIVVIEGPTTLCQEFIHWIKGSKCRPGGFGRNWGHHVRGEIQLDADSSMLAFTNEFQDLGDDLATLASKCRQNGVEDEFLKYVMQH